MFGQKWFRNEALLSLAIVQSCALVSNLNFRHDEFKSQPKYAPAACCNSYELNTLLCRSGLGGKSIEDLQWLDILSTVMETYDTVKQIFDIRQRMYRHDFQKQAWEAAEILFAETGLEEVLSRSLLNGWRARQTTVEVPFLVQFSACLAVIAVDHLFFTFPHATGNNNQRSCTRSIFSTDPRDWSMLNLPSAYSYSMLSLLKLQPKH